MGLISIHNNSIGLQGAGAQYSANQTRNTPCLFGSAPGSFTCITQHTGNTRLYVPSEGRSNNRVLQPILRNALINPILSKDE